ncbi:MAG TPA: FkbM family methyltransferase [Acidobacteriaceae bacterium]|nr:FkbM family methyltransferase [Acidobacteriaceae bacterium]
MLIEYAKQIGSRTLRRFGLALTRYKFTEELQEMRRAAEDLRLIQHLPDQDALRALRYLPLSHSQLRQDLFVLSELGWKCGGFFVEFGATDGLHLSNTLLLEREFGWTGILAEPARRWHKDLARNRSSLIDTNCVWSESNAVLQFNETKDTGLSTIQSFSRGDTHAFLRRRGHVYSVTTISLMDLLARHNAPCEIDYLSMDTEGSEFEILSVFDFNKYLIRVITIEHNFGATREKICNLLSGRGYQRKLKDLSSVDDWYVLRS